MYGIHPHLTIQLIDQHHEAIRRQAEAGRLRRDVRTQRRQTRRRSP